MTHVVLFCGGRGATTIIRSLARTTNVQLSAVVNAYDAGLSTGRVRDAVAGMLGPSDIRKTASTLARAGSPGSRASFVADVLEHRLGAGPDVTAVADRDRIAYAQFSALMDGSPPPDPSSATSLLGQLPLGSWWEIRQALVAFEKELRDRGVSFSYDDLAIGNAVLAGLFLELGGLDPAIRRFEALLGTAPHRVFNVSRGEDLWLSARAGSWVCTDEGALVAGGVPAPINDVYLLPRADHKATYGDTKAWVPAADLPDPSTLEELPELNEQLADVIAAADVIVYGPGTQHSSLFPTYLTVGLAEAIAGNTTAEKLFVANIGRDLDQHPDETVQDALNKFLYFLSRRGRTSADLRDYVTTVLVDDSHASDLQQLPEGVAARAASWSEPGGKHSGPAVKEEIASVVRRRSGEQLHGDWGLASIIVPVLNERPRVGAVLNQLRYLDLSSLGLVSEIIVVDGGSTDGTLELLEKTPDITLIRDHCSGRGAAVRRGLEAARGELVATFPSDAEYDAAALVEVFTRLQDEPDSVVIGSRALGGSRAGQRLREIYGDNSVLYALSHWGGVAMSLLLMMRLDCVISDPLSGVKAARRSTFRSLDNEGTRLDYDIRWVKAAILNRHRLLEVPVHYQPRGWRDGKKTTVFDGVRALRATVQSGARR